MKPIIPDTDDRLAGDAAPSRPTCRTKPFTQSFSECLENDPLCRYSLPFGHTRLCKHPMLCEFGDAPQVANPFPIP